MSATITESVKREVLLPNEDGHQYGYSRLTPYVHPPETKAELPWTDLVTIDLEDFDRPGGKERLAKQLEHAVHHGISQEQIDHQFTLAKTLFDLDIEEKAKYESPYSAADFNGWRQPGRFKVTGSQVTPNVELYGIPKFIRDFEGRYQHPDLIKAHLPEIEEFQRALHSNIVLPLLRLFAIILQLQDEEYLVKQHTYDKKSEDHLRYMILRKRSSEEHATSDSQIPGHTDLETVTLLFRQPIARLQILAEDGNWNYVPAKPGTVTVNLSDTISHLTGGWLKSCIHRVVAPPEDQVQYDRTGLLYFARTHNDTILNPITDSPVLEKAGVKPLFEKPVAMEEWVKAKQSLQLNPDVAGKKWAESKGDTVEVIAGFRDRSYK